MRESSNVMIFKDPDEISVQSSSGGFIDDNSLYQKLTATEKVEEDEESVGNRQQVIADNESLIGDLHPFAKSSFEKIWEKLAQPLWKILLCLIIFTSICSLLIIILFFMRSPPNEASLIYYRNESEEFRLEKSIGSIQVFPNGQIQLYYQDKSSEFFDLKTNSLESTDRFVLPKVMEDLNCKKTRWIDGAVCCVSDHSLTRCSLRQRNGDWRLLGEHFKRAEFYQRDGQVYILGQEKPNSQPVLYDLMGNNSTLKTYNCGDSTRYSYFTVIDEEVVIVYRKSRRDPGFLLLRLDPLDEREYKCLQSNDDQGFVHGLWIYQSLLWIYQCPPLPTSSWSNNYVEQYRCHVELRLVENLLKIYQYSVDRTIMTNLGNYKEGEYVMGRAEDDSLYLYPFKDQNQSSIIWKERFAFPRNNCSLIFGLCNLFKKKTD